MASPKTGARVYFICISMTLFASFIFAGCVGVTPVPSPTPIPSDTPTTTSTPIPPTLTFTPMSTRTATAVLTPTIDPPPESPICSPVRDLAFDDIRKVIRGTFEMPDRIATTMYSDGGHHGVDIGYFNFKGHTSIMGAPIQAALDGKIAAIVYNRIPYGNMVIIETPYQKVPAELRNSLSLPEGQSLYHLYAHFRELQPLILGQQVKCGDLLGLAGQSGKVTGPHLHFETRYGPPGAIFAGGMAFYIAGLTDAEWKNYIYWRMSGTFRLFDPMEFLNLPFPVPTPAPWTIAQ
jgi:murein DD-endopeptidase MepM/ murein hydrolase activator NlpD